MTSTSSNNNRVGSDRSGGPPMHNMRLPAGTWKRIAEYADKNDCSIEEAVARMVYRSRRRGESNDQSQEKPSPESKSTSEETAMDRLKRAVDRLNSLSGNDGDSKHESTNQQEAAEPKSRPANALADFLNDEEEPDPVPEGKQTAEEDTASLADLSAAAIGEMLGKHDRLCPPEPPTAEERPPEPPTTEEHPEESKGPVSMFEIAKRQGDDATSDDATS